MKKGDWGNIPRDIFGIEEKDPDAPPNPKSSNGVDFVEIFGSMENVPVHYKRLYYDKLPECPQANGNMVPLFKPPREDRYWSHDCINFEFSLCDDGRIKCNKCNQKIGDYTIDDDHMKPPS